MEDKKSSNMHSMSRFRSELSYRCLAVFLLLSCSAVAGMAGQMQEWLNESAMTAAFGGRTLSGKYATGTPFTETYAADGSITYWDPTISATGRWHASKQGFCTFYENMTGGCFAARKIGENCFEFYLIESQDTGPLGPKEGQPYVAQGWYPDRKPTCEALTT
jgi:hypothetical protein